jgi:predicted ATP-grasp superfamily ATP-dependent carboligase
MFEIQLARGAKASSGTLVTAFPSVGMVGTIVVV